MIKSSCYTPLDINLNNHLIYNYQNNIILQINNLLKLIVIIKNSTINHFNIKFNHLQNINKSHLKTQVEYLKLNVEHHNFIKYNYQQNSIP